MSVGLCIERSEYTVLSILGVLKAGGCYVPMEASYPEERIRYIVLCNIKDKNKSHFQI